jgi:hypothetical protein
MINQHVNCKSKDDARAMKHTEPLFGFAWFGLAWLEGGTFLFRG